MSITGVVLWELLSTYRHRTALRAEGKLPAARPRYGLARRIWFRQLTGLASLLALRDGYTTTDLAWQAAINAVDRYGSARAARKAVRAGRPVPRPELLDVDASESDDADQRDIMPHEGELRDVQVRHTDAGITLRHTQRDSLNRDNERDAQARPGDHEITEQHAERDTATPGDQREATAETAAPARETTSARDDHDPAAPIEPPDAVAPPTALRNDLFDLLGDQGETTANAGEEQEQDDAATGDRQPSATGEPTAHDSDDTDAVPPAGDGDRPREQPNNSKGAVIARMKTYARERAAQGEAVTGADLDRQFGTRDYGRKVLRHLAAESAQST